MDKNCGSTKECASFVIVENNPDKSTESDSYLTGHDVSYTIEKHTSQLIEKNDRHLTEERNNHFDQEKHSLTKTDGSFEKNDRHLIEERNNPSDQEKPSSSKNDESFEKNDRHLIEVRNNHSDQEKPSLTKTDESFLPHVCFCDENSVNPSLSNTWLTCGAERRLRELMELSKHENATGDPEDWSSRTSQVLIGDASKKNHTIEGNIRIKHKDKNLSSKKSIKRVFKLKNLKGYCINADCWKRRRRARCCGCDRAPNVYTYVIPECRCK